MSNPYINFSFNNPPVLLRETHTTKAGHAHSKHMCLWALMWFLDCLSKSAFTRHVLLPELRPIWDVLYRKIRRDVCSSPTPPPPLTHKSHKQLEKQIELVGGDGGMGLRIRGLQPFPKGGLEPLGGPTQADKGVKLLSILAPGEPLASHGSLELWGTPGPAISDTHTHAHTSPSPDGKFNRTYIERHTHKNT